MEHLHGDTNIIEKTTNSHRYTRQMERCNARFLKLSPAVLQNTLGNELHNIPDSSHSNMQQENILNQTEVIKKRRNRRRKALPNNNATPNTDEIAIQPKKGRPKKTTTMNDGSTLAIAPQTQQPKRGRRRPKKH